MYKYPYLLTVTDTSTDPAIMTECEIDEISLCE